MRGMFVEKINLGEKMMYTCDVCDGVARIGNYVCENCDGKGVVDWVRNIKRKVSIDYVLYWTCRSGNLKKLKYAVKQGADIHTYSDLALIWSARSGHLEVVKFLIEQGADVYAYNGEALHWATENKYSEIVEYLTKIIKREEK
jgi:hypothetical protein